MKNMNGQEAIKSRLGFITLRHSARLALAGVAFGAFLFGQAPWVRGQDVSVLTHHNDNARTGAQLHETQLTPAHIQSIGLHLRGSGSINGYVTGQPLYVQSVSFASGTSAAVYVVDTTNTVYIFSPIENSNHTLNLINSRTLEPTNPGTTDNVGIMSTPVIDEARQLIYVVARAADSTPAPPPYAGRGNAKFVLHALDLATLEDRFNPVTLAASVVVPRPKCTDLPCNQLFATFVPIVERQRTALLLNHVGSLSFVSFGFGSMPGSLGENGDPNNPVPLQHGWAFTYDVTNQPVLANVYLSTRVPDSPAGVFAPGGIWQGGAGFAADSFGNVFLATGNALVDAKKNDGDSIVRLTSAGARFWSAAVPNAAFLNAHDLDLSSGGPIVLPHNSGASRVFAIAKDGSAALLRVFDDIVNNPAFICPLQAFPGCQPQFQAVVNPSGTDEVFWENPVYWNGNVYYVGTNGDFLNGLPWDSAQGVFTSITPKQISDRALPKCGHIGLSLSANGTSDPILWAAVEGDGCTSGELDAYDPNKPNSPPIWTFPFASGVHLSRFPMATIAGGRIFVVTAASPFQGPSSLLAFALGGK
jgi:hypothetical protein